MPCAKQNAKNLWKAWVVDAKMSFKTKAIAQNFNGRAFVNTKKSTNATLKGLFKFVTFMCPAQSSVVFYKFCIYF